jgi:hypothetical protein
MLSSTLGVAQGQRGMAQPPPRICRMANSTIDEK